MSELYNISFSDGTSTVSSGTISLSIFINKIISTSTPTYTYSSGFEWGYYNDNYHAGGYSGNQTWFDTRTPVYTHNSPGRSRVTDFTNISTASSGQTSVNGDETYSYLWTGYFKAPITSTYYFNTRSDDNSHMWVGTSALNPSYSNETVDNGGLHGMQTVTSAGVSLTGGVYYDFRMTFGEEGGGDDLQAQWRNNSTSFSYDWSTVAFSNRQVSGGSGSGSTINIAFHYGTFSSSDYSGLYSTVSAATTAGHLYSDSPSGTYTWGTLGTPSLTSTNTTYTWTPTTTVTGKLLMVAGGGGGGGTIAGGGGAGGVVYYANQSLSGTKTIVVGNGGAGGYGWDYFPRQGSSGTNTTFTGLTTAIGGGGGGGHGYSTGNVPQTGGSGGGGAQNVLTGASGTAGQGNAGGNAHDGFNYAGGGGGAGGAGGTSGGSAGGIGGIGIDYSSDFGITYGDSGWFASGGGGGVRDGSSRVGGTASIGGGGNGNNLDSGAYTAAQKHTGGGGGGGGFAGGGNFMTGGVGGSGIVLIKY